MITTPTNRPATNQQAMSPRITAPPTRFATAISKQPSGRTRVNKATSSRPHWPAPIKIGTAIFKTATALVQTICCAWLSWLVALTADLASWNTSTPKSALLNRNTSKFRNARQSHSSGSSPHQRLNPNLHRHLNLFRHQRLIFSLTANSAGRNLKRKGATLSPARRNRMIRRAEYGCMPCAAQFARARPFVRQLP